MNLKEYPPALQPLLAGERLNELGPGRPRREHRPLLAALKAETLLPGGEPKRHDLARACLSGLWLLHDFLEESHALSQDLQTVEGSFWHGIMHRREPDAANAAYWFRRVGKHDVFPALAEQARTLGLQALADRWDPYHFIDLCEKHRGKGNEQEALLQRMQRAEWETLFGWCWRGAFPDTNPGIDKPEETA